MCHVRPTAAVTTPNCAEFDQFGRTFKSVGEAVQYATALLCISAILFAPITITVHYLTPQSSSFDMIFNFR